MVPQAKSNGKVLCQSHLIFISEYTLGRVTSTELYKCSIDPLLHGLEEKKYCSRIGHLYVGAPICADDVLLASSNMTGPQHMFDEACIYSQKESYILHPQKSAVIPVKSKHPLSFRRDLAPWSLNDEKVQVVDSGKQLLLRKAINLQTKLTFNREQWLADEQHTP